MTSSPPDTTPTEDQIKEWVAHPLALTDDQIAALDDLDAHIALVNVREQVARIQGHQLAKANEYNVTMRVLAVLIEGLQERDGGDRVTVPMNKLVAGPDIRAWYDKINECYVLATHRDDRSMELG